MRGSSVGRCFSHLRRGEASKKKLLVELLDPLVPAPLERIARGAIVQILAVKDRKLLPYQRQYGLNHHDLGIGGNNGIATPHVVSSGHQRDHDNDRQKRRAEPMQAVFGPRCNPNCRSKPAGYEHRGFPQQHGASQCDPYRHRSYS